MTEADTTRGRHVVVGLTRGDAVSRFGPELEDVFATSFADFDAEVPAGSCSRVSLAWDEGALPVATILLDRMTEEPGLRLDVVGRRGAPGTTSAAPAPPAGEDWAAESLHLRVVDLERELDEARADAEEARAQLATARARNRRLKAQVDGAAQGRGGWLLRRLSGGRPRG